MSQDYPAAQTIGGTSASEINVGTSHEHNWIEHAPATCGGQPVWSCSGCGRYETQRPLELRPTLVPTRLASLLDAGKLRRIADCMDELNRRRVDEFGPAADDHSMQNNLRAWANGLDAGSIA